ncbi:hypothetical protein ILYODFUR_024106 [Ilyodon furcidens]|uniref:Uncharacterized protein n=1 Tax=Ilyodon furcidens TaxID=33524 RepID=A0ABV0SQJ9_9TELE
MCICMRPLDFQEDGEEELFVREHRKTTSTLKIEEHSRQWEDSSVSLNRKRSGLHSPLSTRRFATFRLSSRLFVAGRSCADGDQGKTFRPTRGSADGSIRVDDHRI